MQSPPSILPVVEDVVVEKVYKSDDFWIETSWGTCPVCVTWECIDSACFRQFAEFWLGFVLSSSLLIDLQPFLPALTFRFQLSYRDQFCSLTFSLANLYFVGCIYDSGFKPDWRKSCGLTAPHWAAQLVLAASPLFCRFVQSLRRWYDSRLNTHLVNVSNSSLFGINIRPTPAS